MDTGSAALLLNKLQARFVALRGCAGRGRNLITKKRESEGEGKMRNCPRSHQVLHLDFLSKATFPSVSAKVISFFPRSLSPSLNTLSFSLFASIYFSTEAIT